MNTNTSDRTQTLFTPWLRKVRWVCASMAVAILAACGGGGGASDVTANSDNRNSSFSTANNTVLILANQLNMVSLVNTGDNSSVLVIESNASDDLKNISVGQAVYFPAGEHAKFPLGFSGIAESVVTTSQGRKEILIKQAGIFDVFDSIKLEQQSISLSADNYVGAIAPSIIRGSSALQSAQTGLLMSDKHDLNGALILKSTRSSAANRLMMGLNFLGQDEVSPGDIVFNKTIDLDELFSSEANSVSDSFIQKIQGAADPKLSINFKLSNLKLTTIIDGEKAFDSIPYKVHNYKFKVEGEMSSNVSFNGGANIKMNAMNKAWREVEEDTYEKLGMKFKLAGLDGKDKIGKFPLAGLIFSPECVSGCPIAMGKTQSPIRAAKYGGVIIWVYWNLNGTISFEGQLGTRSNAKFAAGAEGDLTKLNIINALEAYPKDRNLLEAPYAEGKLDLVAKFGFSTDVDVFLGGVRFGSAGMFLGAHPAMNINGKISYVKPDLNYDWRWDGDLCVKVNLQSGAIFVSDVRFSVDERKIEYAKRYPDAGEDLSVPGLHGLWYTTEPKSFCFPKPSIADVNVQCFSDKVKFLVTGLNLPDDLQIAASGVCADSSTAEFLATDAHTRASITCNTSSSIGKAFNYTITSARASNLDVVARNASCPELAKLNATPTNPTVLQTVSFWLTEAYDTVKSVVWNFGVGIAEKTAAVANGISTTVTQAFSTTGAKPVTATLKDAANKVLGTLTTTINVSALPMPTATITWATSDTATQPGAIANNGTTDDTTPTLKGTLSAALTGTQHVNIYDGSTQFAAYATASGTSWTFTPAAPLAGGSHSFTAEVGDGVGNTGARSTAYVINILAPGITSATPAEAMRTVPTTFTVVGRDLPTSGITVTMPDDTDSRAKCNAPTGMTATGFTVVCTLYKFDEATDAQRKLVISAGAKQLGTHTVSIQSNITDVNWAAPSTGNVYGKGTVQFKEDITFKATGTNLLADTGMGFAVELCGVANKEVGTPTNTQRTFTCLFNDEAGAVVGQMPLVFKDKQGGGGLYRVNVPVVVAPVSGTGKLPDTGITAAQCYAAGSDALVSCTSAAAIALNPKQDGMVGRDVTSSSNTDGKLGFSYSVVGSYSKEECVKDNITGLTWEGKPTTGLRAAANTYTNYGDNSANDASTYVAAVNAVKLCSYSDWRLPTADELQGLVDYSVVTYPSPTIDGTWFTNTQLSVYWTGTGYAGNSGYAWSVDFYTGSVYDVIRVFSSGRIRLVR